MDGVTKPTCCGDIYKFSLDSQEEGVVEMGGEGRIVKQFEIVGDTLYAIVKKKLEFSLEKATLTLGENIWEKISSDQVLEHFTVMARKIVATDAALQTFKFEI